jgi:peptide/nickel transport system substrate-binding protein
MAPPRPALRTPPAARPLLLVLLLSACAPPGTGDALVLGWDTGDLMSLDPATSYEITGAALVPNLYDTLVGFDDDDLSEPRPRLAERWETRAAGDRLEVRFHLRDARFTTGRPVTAADAVFSLRRVLELNQGPAFLLSSVLGLRVEDFEAEGPRALVVRLPPGRAARALLAVLAGPVGGIVDRAEALAHEEAGDRGSGWLRDHSAGAGRYALRAWEMDARVVLERHDGHWAGPAPTPRVIVKHVAESENQRFRLRVGDLDVARNLNPEQLADLERDPSVEVHRFRTLMIYYLGLDCASPAFRDPRARRAVRHALDREGIAGRLLRGNGEALATLIPRGLPGAAPDLALPHDPARARALLAEAGLRPPVACTLLAGNGIAPGGVPCADLAAKVKSDLDRVGFDVRLRVVASSEMLSIYRARRAEMVLVEWVPDFPDPDGNVGPFTDESLRSVAWRLHFADAALAAEARAAAAEPDPAARAERYRRIEAALIERGPYATLYQGIAPLARRRDVEGLRFSPVGQLPLERLRKLRP